VQTSSNQSFDCSFYCTLSSRLLSQQRRIMEGERGWHNGLQLNVHFMGCILHNHRNFSMIRSTMGGSHLKSLSRPRGVLKSPGNFLGKLIYMYYNIVKSYFCTICYVSRLRELHTLKGHVESVVKLKGIDIETIQQHYTV